MSDQTTNQDWITRNPKGTGGFADHPENRSDGRWSKDNSFSYWMNFFKKLTVAEFKDYQRTKPDDQRTVAESLAYVRVLKSRDDLKEFQEVANRTEGKSVETTKMIHEGSIDTGSKSDRAEMEAIAKRVGREIMEAKMNGKK